MSVEQLENLVREGTEKTIWSYKSLEQIKELRGFTSNEEVIEHLEEITDSVIESDPDYKDNALYIKNKYFGGK